MCNLRNEFLDCSISDLLVSTITSLTNSIQIFIYPLKLTDNFLSSFEFWLNVLASPVRAWSVTSEALQEFHRAFIQYYPLKLIANELPPVRVASLRSSSTFWSVILSQLDTFYTHCIQIPCHTNRSDRNTTGSINSEIFSPFRFTST